MLLKATFTEEEVKDAVWSCNGSKIAGPDGFSFSFFHKYWETIKKDVVRFMEDFYSKPSLTKAASMTSFLTLVPKVVNLRQLINFIPICLVSSFQKVQSKVLASRLKNVIGSLISVEETAFVAGRCMSDGVIVVMRS